MQQPPSADDKSFEDQLAAVDREITRLQLMQDSTYKTRAELEDKCKALGADPEKLQEALDSLTAECETLEARALELSTKITEVLSAADGQQQ